VDHNELRQKHPTPSQTGQTGQNKIYKMEELNENENQNQKENEKETSPIDPPNTLKRKRSQLKHIKKGLDKF